MLKMLKKLHREESGQDLIEYALVALLIALAAIAGMSSVGGSVNSEFARVAGYLS